MSGKPVELYVVERKADGDCLLLLNVWLQKAGDVYVVSHQPNIVANKFSYHDSGQVHRDIFLFNERFRREKRTRLRDLKGFERVGGAWAPVAVSGEPYAVKADTKSRRTLEVSSTPFGWIIRVWAVERDRHRLAKAISEVAPFPDSTVETAFLADWSDPWLLITVAKFTVPEPYRVVRHDSVSPGRSFYELVPREYEGTFLDMGPWWA